MAACLRGAMYQTHLAALSLAARPDRTVRSLATSWRQTSVPNYSTLCPGRPAGVSAMKNDHHRALTTVIIKWSGSLSSSMGTKSISSSSLSSSRPPSILGYNTVDTWNTRKDLQPCQAILREDVVSSSSVAEAIDGRAIAKDIRLCIAEEVARIKDTAGKPPGLGVVLVGNRTDSATFVRTKKKACEEVGMAFFGVSLPEEVTEAEVLEHVRRLNDDPDVHGALVQLPLPKHMCEETVIGAVDVDKDVDGFHPLNAGNLALHGRIPLHVSCASRGCIELLIRSGVTMKGKNAVVIGRNDIGMPVAFLLQRQNATVTIVHSYTSNPAEVTRGADIVIVAVDVPHLVRGDWIKPGAVVIDAGMNYIEDPKVKMGYRLVGDVCYEEASRVASKITPVPGGVGPVTIAMLLTNTLDSAKRSFGLADTNKCIQ